MPTKKKETRGRKRLPNNEKKIPIITMVPKKHSKPARVELAAIGAKYAAL